MDCGFLLMTGRNFGPQPWSGWTNRAVCLLAVRHILRGETKIPIQGSGHPRTAHLDQYRDVGPRLSDPAPWPAPSSSPQSSSKLGHTLHFLHSFSPLRPLQPGPRRPTAGGGVSQARGSRKGVLGVGGMSVQP